MKKTLTQTFICIFILQLIIPPVSAEQLKLRAPDVEPPSIIFNQNQAELEEGIQTFSATVTDNVGVASVTLYYKGENDVAFMPQLMQKDPSNPDLYTAALSIDSVISKRLEVYLRADDVSGNSIFEGQKFSPFTFTIIPESQQGKLASGDSPVAEEEGMSIWMMTLIGIGVLALAGGGSGGGGGTSDTSNTGTITITTPLPGG